MTTGIWCQKAVIFQFMPMLKILNFTPVYNLVSFVKKSLNFSSYVNYVLTVGKYSFENMFYIHFFNWGLKFKSI